MARGIGRAPLRGLLPVPVRDGYGRDRVPADFDTIVIENDRLRVTVLPRPRRAGSTPSTTSPPAASSSTATPSSSPPPAEALGGLWTRTTGEPLPDAYEFRMRPNP